MSFEWDFVICIPSINLPFPIEGKSLIAIGSNDPRYEEIRKAKQKVDKFLDCFSTPFGKKLVPSIILKKAGSPKIDSRELISFRNLIAISSVIKSKIDFYHYRRIIGIPFSDFFDLYPIYPSSRDGDEDLLIIDTVAEMGLDHLDKFQGQPNSVVVYPENFKPTFDDRLLDSLLKLWDHKFYKKDDKLFKNRVFRSIEMAYQALRAPYVHMGNKTDYGIILSSWVAAFEILANPIHRGVNFEDVSNLITNVPWHSKKLRRKSYRPIISGKNNKTKKFSNVTLPIQIYGRLNRTRNLFLHGSQLPEIGIEANKRKTWGPLELQIPALYRSVLLYLLTTKGFGQFPVNDFRYEHDQMEQGRIEEILYKKFKESDNDDE